MKIVALQLDPLETLEPSSDSSLFLAREAQKLGLSLFSYAPDQLSLQGDEPIAWGCWLTLKNDDVSFYHLSSPQHLPLSEVDFVLIRQNPPYDMQYLTTLSLLEHLPAAVRVINHPQGIRQAPEKLFGTHLPEFIPPTLISVDERLIEDFFVLHPQAVLKPLYSFGGQEVLLLDVTNWRKALQDHVIRHREPPIWQKFLPAIYGGDRRILMFNGEVVGSYSRIPPPGDFLSNTGLGGRETRLTNLTSHELGVCKTLGPLLRNLGLYFVAVDLIEGYLIEINVTSPTGLMLYFQLSGVNLAQKFWQDLLQQNPAT